MTFEELVRRHSPAYRIELGETLCGKWDVELTLRASKSIGHQMRSRIRSVHRDLEVALEDADAAANRADHGAVNLGIVASAPKTPPPPKPKR